MERVTLLIDGLREDDREAGSDIIFVVADGYAFEPNVTSLQGTPPYDAARKKLVFVAGVVDAIVANPGVGLGDHRLDPYRAYVDLPREKVRELRARGVRPQNMPTVVRNESPRIRTVEGYARELQEKRRAEREAEAARQAAAREAGERDVHWKKAPSSGASAKKERRDFAAELKPNGTWDATALDDLLKLFNDEITKGKADSSYRLNWPSKVGHVKASLNPLIVEAGGEGCGTKSSLELMEHFAKELKKIKDACA